MKQRHKHHDNIIDDLEKGDPPKVIAYRWKAPLATIYDIKNKCLEFIPRRKFDPGEGQLNFFDVWKNL